ncbi:MAG: hypothetical protein GX279_03850 [Clostridiaceae bacterium]|nr:hypothetical protein [Clostridiaceae bacterium]
MKKGDTIQKYIDSISEIINNAKQDLKPSRQLMLRQRMKNMKLKTDMPSRIYYLASKRNIKKAL